MNIRQFTGAMIVAMALAGCATSRTEPDPGAQHYLGLYAVNVLRRPTSIQSFNYRAPDGTNLAAPLPKPADPSIAAELRDLLFDADSFHDPGPPERFVRDVAFKVSSDERSIDIALSFSSDQIQLRTKGPGGQFVLNYASMSPVREKLLRIVKQAIPDFRISGK